MKQFIIPIAHLLVGIIAFILAVYSPVAVAPITCYVAGLLSGVNLATGIIKLINIIRCE